MAIDEDGNEDGTFDDEGPALEIPGDDRPEVRIVSASPHHAIDEISEHLYLDKGIYVRGKELVTIVGALPPSHDAATPASESAPLIVPIGNAMMTERIAKHIRCTRRKPLSKRQETLASMGGKVPPPEWVPCLPPPLVVAGLLERRQWPLRHLVAVSETPILRPDGTLVQTPGYDHITGFVYRPNCEFPTIPDAPDQAAARAALATLLEPFADFPYPDETSPSRMVPIAAILSIVARSAIRGSVPAFLFDATTRGSGKTLQADAVSAIALGRSAARKSYPAEEEELGKILTSYAMAGARLILFDNVTREFGGGELDQCITARDTVELRVLGKSEMRVLPWSAVIMASGNNITLGEDTVRRVLVARLESKLENPEDRTDLKHPDLFEWILENRPKLVAAALTLLRAYTCLGKDRPQGKVWGSFESWSRLIPGAIVYAGGVDPMLARPSAEQHTSPTTQALGTVLAMLPLLDPAATGLTCREIVAILYPPKGSDRTEKATLDDGFDALRDAFEAWTAPKAGQPPSLLSLAKRFQANVGRVVKGHKLQRIGGGGSRSVRWGVASC